MDEGSSELLGRLDAIADSLARDGRALALIGLGSVGVDQNRLDAHSDLDFFVIVEPEFKQAFIEDLTWLEEVAPIAFSFQNTVDGHKVLFEDGIYAEFGVFGPDELADVPADARRVVWQAEGIDASGWKMRTPALPEPRPVDWLLGEILTNLYVGLTRLRRGERLSAERFIQGYAVDTLLELWTIVETACPADADRFDRARRFEQRFPEAANRLPDFLQGYQRSAESALAILDFLEGHFLVNAAIKRRIVEAAEAAGAQDRSAQDV
jgi:hypothetical protein